ncbi:hypothetical protein EW145_g8641 [Phellinidium pouzarii]|uniref:Uncharacterized protein n=1 Tax=Phellinidium pouzarii TaxID=167371 RepID=A0A4S4K4M6_9AGAM|nr:hypothetical protein EW145_g8641 [Phellinidium pouzarii]
MTDTGSSSRSTQTQKEYDDIMFLGYLSDDFSYLRRFLIAAEQMVRLLQTELAKNNVAAQEKLVNNIEIAKETLTEAGVSPRPFIPCPPHLGFHRQAYFDMLTTARSLVPHIKDADISRKLPSSRARPLTAFAEAAPPVNVNIPLPLPRSRPVEQQCVAADLAPACAGQRKPNRGL